MKKIDRQDIRKAIEDAIDEKPRQIRMDRWSRIRDYVKAIELYFGSPKVGDKMVGVADINNCKLTRGVGRQSGRILSDSESQHWPLPEEWDPSIPPQAVVIQEGEFDPPGYHSSTHEWNPQWLRGLEAFVRSIVLDEMQKVNRE